MHLFVNGTKNLTLVFLSGIGTEWIKYIIKLFKSGLLSDKWLMTEVYILCKHFFISET